MKLYDVLAFQGRKYDPASPVPGLRRCLVDGQAFYKVRPGTGGARDLSVLGPDEAKAWASSGEIGAPVIADIERRRFTPDDPGRNIRNDVRNSCTGPEVEEDAAFLMRAADLIKPWAKGPVGFYEMIPSAFNVYNLLLCSDSRGLARASASNDYFAATGFLEHVDILCPTMYAAYANADGQKTWAKVPAWNRKECLRLAPGKPAIAFLKPFENSTGMLLPLSFWIDQLKLTRDAGFEGAVLWAGGLEKTTWAEAQRHVEAAQNFVGYVPPRYDTIRVGSGPTPFGIDP